VQHAGTPPPQSATLGLHPVACKLLQLHKSRCTNCAQLHTYIHTYLLTFLLKMPGTVHGILSTVFGAADLQRRIFVVQLVKLLDGSARQTTDHLELRRTTKSSKEVSGSGVTGSYVIDLTWSYRVQVQSLDPRLIGYRSAAKQSGQRLSSQVSSRLSNT